MSKVLITGSPRYSDHSSIESLLHAYLKSIDTPITKCTIISQSKKVGIDVIATQLASKHKCAFHVFYEDPLYSRAISNCDYAIIAEVNDDQESLVMQLTKHKKPFHLIKVKS